MIDIKDKRLIKGAIRRVFRQTSVMKEVLYHARVELPPKTLKDGSVGKKNQIRYKCTECGELFQQKNVAVDHINPVVPVWHNEEEMTIDEIANGIFCSADNLQILCSTKQKELPEGVKSCHALKTNQENFLRAGFETYKKKAGKKSCDLEDSEISLVTIGLENNYIEHLLKQKKELEEKQKRRIEREAKRLKKLEEKELKNEKLPRTSGKLKKT